MHFWRPRLPLINENSPRSCERTGADVKRCQKAWGLDNRDRVEVPDAGPARIVGSCFPKTAGLLGGIGARSFRAMLLTETVISRVNDEVTPYDRQGSLLDICGRLGEREDNSLFWG